jgi:hypothetical protein
MDAKQIITNLRNAIAAIENADSTTARQEIQMAQEQIDCINPIMCQGYCNSYFPRSQLDAYGRCAKCSEEMEGEVNKMIDDMDRRQVMGY